MRCVWWEGVLLMLARVVDCFSYTDDNLWSRCWDLSLHAILTVFIWTLLYSNFYLFIIYFKSGCSTL